MSEIARIGVIGGSGLYNMAALTDIQEIERDTPFGKPSDAIRVGKIAGTPVAFLARHGRSHHLLPTDVPYRANIYAMKSLGVDYIISVSAVGSLQEFAKPLDIVIPDQFVDRTKHRIDTFFGDGVVAHITFAHPICEDLAHLLAAAAENANLPDAKVHRGGAYLCIEGPAFSTKAESQLYRSWGAKVIGMTNVTEAKLAREAEIAYATLALVTDYDCWHPTHDAVSAAMVMEYLRRNVENAQRVILSAVELLSEEPPQSVAHSALRSAIFSDLKKAPPETIKRLELLLKKYL